MIVKLYDVVVIGGGVSGTVAAIRVSPIVMATGQAAGTAATCFIFLPIDKS
ncbi:MAG TPA: hypothetical protein GXX15_07910 [Clostridia bacterium]|nr:hypothetical protein [Clostridia bacterium]